MYAALWESDRMLKMEREERECAAAIQRNKDCLSVSYISFLDLGGERGTTNYQPQPL